MDNPDSGHTTHLLPALPYDHAALEPHIDARTMMLHHDKHHASYVENLNAALARYPELRERSAIWLLLNPKQIPEQARTTVLNNAGGHVNHGMFWRAMSPGGGGGTLEVLATSGHGNPVVLGERRRTRPGESGVAPFTDHRGARRDDIVCLQGSSRKYRGLCAEAHGTDPDRVP